MSLLDPDPRVRRAALGTPAGFLAFGFGSGLSNHAPGTVGTIAALPFALLLNLLPQFAWLLACAGLFLLGVFVCDVTARALGSKDPGGIVWDEMVAMWLTLVFVPDTWPWWLAAFVLFRVFDILKPWPVSLVEKRFAGGLGIMIDDLVAALMAMAVLAVAMRFF